MRVSFNSQVKTFTNLLQVQWFWVAGEQAEEPEDCLSGPNNEPPIHACAQ